MKAPGFWRTDGALPALLSPLSLGMITGAWLRRRTATPYRAPVPVICVGNLVAGGAGKTPVAIAIGRNLGAHGKAVHFLSRGYGGREGGPLRVDPVKHAAADVGDEPLLLARTAPSWIARDRAAGAAAAVAAGAEAIVLDDGFQNPTVAKDLSLVVVDGGYGFGNGRVIPAGPLREPRAAGLARADAVVLMEPDEAGAASLLPPGMPVLRATLAPADADTLRGRTVFAFAGIARPEKFFATLESIGCRISARRAFPDHHPFSDAEIATLLADAARAGAVPVTTEKDAVRLPPAMRDKVATLPVELRWADDAAVETLLARVY
jgi:tetraacyldisaccharide 4'-kinase